MLRFAEKNRLWLRLAVIFAIAVVPGLRAQRMSSAANVTSDAGGSVEEQPPKTSEPWDTPRLPGNPSLVPPPQTTVLGSKEYPEFTRELVEGEWRGRDPVELWVLKPANMEKPPVILYLYSYPSDVNRFESIEFERFLTSRGFAAVGFASAFTGQRYHDLPMKMWFVSELPVALSATAHDVQMILNYLAQRGDFDMSHVGMYGEGSGASIAIMAAAVDSRITVLDLLNPWGDWPDWLAKSPLVPERERPDYLRPEFLARLKNLDPLEWLPQLTTQQVRLQYVNGTAEIPDIVKRRMKAAAPPKIVDVQYESPEAFRAQIAGKDFDWIKKQLGSLAAQEGSSVTAKSSIQNPREP